MNIQLYRKEFEDCWDYFTIDLFLPSIIINKKDKIFPRTHKICDFRFTTSFRIVQDEVSRNFLFRILGFGIGYYRQWSY